MAQRCTDAASRHLYGEALTIAAANRTVDVMKALLEITSDIDLETLTSTLNSICVWGAGETLQLFLKYDAKKMLGIQQFSEGLSRAAQTNNRQAVVYWLNEHPEHHKLVVDPETVIEVSRYGFMDVLPPLTEHIRSTDSFEKILSQCLQVASEHGHKEVVEYLIGEGANFNAVVEEACCTREGTNLFKDDLYNHIHKITHKPSTLQEALQTAARRELSSLPIIKTLVEANASVSSIDISKAAALNEALSFFGTRRGLSVQGKKKFRESLSIEDVLTTGPGAVVKFLLANLPEEKADDTRFSHLAQMACIAGDQDCVELLLQRGLDVNISGHYYGTALQAAARVGNLAIVEHLLNSGADLNILQGVHGTALRAAVIGGHEDLVRMLIARGADVNLRYRYTG